MRANYTYQELSIAQVLVGDSIIAPNPHTGGQGGEKLSGVVTHITPTNKGDRVRVHMGHGNPVIFDPDTTVRVARAS